MQDEDVQDSSTKLKIPKLDEESPTSSHCHGCEVDLPAQVSTVESTGRTDELVNTGELDGASKKVKTGERQSPQVPGSVIDAEELEIDRVCENVRDKMKRKFLVDMPEDFYQFWEFCKTLSSSHPESKHSTAAMYCK